MTEIVIYTDFDGTLTQKPGRISVLEDFYQSLLQGYQIGFKQPYKETPMINADALQEAFTQQFGRYVNQTDDSLMSPETVLSLQTILQKDLARVNIVTKNRVEYIKAVFRYQGFSNDEITKLNIMDSGDKYSAVKENLKEIGKKVIVCVFDDDLEDYKAMVKAVEESEFRHNLVGYHHRPKEFMWGKYLAQIQEFHSLESLQNSKFMQAPSAKRIVTFALAGLAVALFTSLLFSIIGIELGAFDIISFASFSLAGSGVLGAASGIDFGKRTQISSQEEGRGGLTTSHSKINSLGGFANRLKREPLPMDHYPAILSDSPKRTKRRMELTVEQEPHLNKHIL